MININKLIEEEALFNEQRIIIDLSRIEDADYNVLREAKIKIEVKKNLIEVLNDNEPINFAFLTEKMRIKNKDEREEIKNTIAKILGGETKDFSFLNDLIKDIERYLVTDAGKLVKKADFQKKLYKDPSNKPALFDLAENMKAIFNIVGVKFGDSAVYYVFDGKTYKQITKKDYQELTLEQFGIRLTEQNAKDSLHSLPATAEEENYYWEFADNEYLDTRTYEIVDKEAIGYIPLTSRQFKFNDELIPYNAGVSFNGSGTFWEKTLKEILIPKQDPEDDKLYMEFLYLIGASMVGNNPLKLLALGYNPEGNNAKTLLVIMLLWVFNNTFFRLSVKELSNDFLYSRANDTNVIVIDEILNNSLNGKEAILKELTAGGDPTISAREMFTTTRDISKGFGMLWIFCNPLPEFTYDKALFHRLHLFKLPNRFDDNPTKPNEYMIDYNIEQKLKADTQGFIWFLNACIKAKQEYKFQRQSVEETISILWEQDPIRKFLAKNYEVSNNDKDIITNDEITMEAFKDPEIKNEYKTTEKLNKKIGFAIKDVFGITRMPGFVIAKYNLKMREK